MSAWTCPEAEAARPAGEFVVFLGKGDNVPNMDVGGCSDCYVNMSITDASGAPVRGVQGLVQQGPAKAQARAKAQAVGGVHGGER